MKLRRAYVMCLWIVVALSLATPSAMSETAVAEFVSHRDAGSWEQALDVIREEVRKPTRKFDVL